MDNQKLPKKQKQETEQPTRLLPLIHRAGKSIRLYPAGHSLVKSWLAAAHQLPGKVLTPLTITSPFFQETKICPADSDASQQFI